MRSPAPAVHDRRATRVLMPLALAGLALAGRLVPVLRGGGLSGRDAYDPFVYYSAAVALFTGKVPYRDFLLLHPPGILLALQPFAAVGAVFGDPVGLATARVGFMLLGAANTALVYYLLRRDSIVGAVVGAGLYAVWFPAFYVERTVRLEGLATFLVLLGLVACRRIPRLRRPWLGAATAGGLFALAATVKLWGVLPVAVLVGWLWWEHGRRPALAGAAGAMLAAATVMLPFTVAAPGWFQSVVLDQLDRTRGRGLPLRRLQDLFGLGPLPPDTALLPVIVAGILTLVAVVVTRRTRFGRLVGLLAVTGVVLLLAAPSWYPHYPAFVAAPLCLLYGDATGHLVERIPRPSVRVLPLTVLALGIALAHIVLVTQASVGYRFPGAELSHVLAERPGCVTSDRPATLVLSDTLRRNLATGCPVVVDVLGYGFARQGAHLTPQASRLQFQQFLVDQLAGGQSAVLLDTDPDRLPPDLRARVRSWPVVATVGRVQVLQPPAPAK